MDIYNVVPDIGYCVDVYNSTTYTLVHSDCNITDTGFSYPMPRDGVCHIYLFTVTSVNVAGNGSRNTVSYFETNIRKYVRI